MTYLFLHSLCKSLTRLTLTRLTYFLSHDFLSYINSLGLSANSRNVRLYYPYWQYPNLFKLCSKLLCKSRFPRYLEKHFSKTNKTFTAIVFYYEQNLTINYLAMTFMQKRCLFHCSNLLCRLSQFHLQS